MANFLLAVCLLAFNALFAVTEASSRFNRKASLLKKQPSLLPAWFKIHSGELSTESWNIFGQWYHQSSSKPSGEYTLLGQVREVQDLWRFVAPEELKSISRVDLSVFRPGYEPDFAQLMSHRTGFILSYRITSDMMPVPTSPVKLSRNEVMRLNRAGKSTPTHSPASHFQVFDSLIEAAMKTGKSDDKMSSTPTCTTDYLTSEIMGILFKRQYKHTFVQVFLEGVACSRARETEEQISAFILSVLPGIELPGPRRYRLASYSLKIISGSPNSRATSLSPKKSPSRTVVIVNANGSDSGEEAEAEFAESISESNEKAAAYSDEFEEEEEVVVVVFDERIDYASQEKEQECGHNALFKERAYSMSAAIDADADADADAAGDETEEEEEKILLASDEETGSNVSNNTKSNETIHEEKLLNIIFNADLDLNAPLVDVLAQLKIVLEKEFKRTF